MTFGCEKCGRITHHTGMAAGGAGARCSNCGAAMVPMTLGGALRLARERDEARRWRSLAGLGDGAPERTAGSAP